MKLRSTAAVALVSVAALLGGTLTASAQERGPRVDRQSEHRLQAGDGDHLRFEGRHGKGGQNRMGGMGGGFFALSCGTNGANRLERRFDRLSERLNLTAEQKPQFDALETAVLAAQTTFADACAAERPTAAVTPQPKPDATTPSPDAGKDMAAKPERPDMLKRMQTRLKLEDARITAMTDLMPALETLYATLTDEQKASLEPRRGKGGMRGGRNDRDSDRGREGRWHHRHDRQH